MTQEQPITPPPELFKQWEGIPRSLAFEAAYRAGADMELEACCEWLDFYAAASEARDLRAARRPKPPSLKELALSELNLTADPDGAELSRTQVDLIRKALEALPDD